MDYSRIKDLDRFELIEAEAIMRFAEQAYRIYGHEWTAHQVITIYTRYYLKFLSN